jgi:hypothetical protein
MFKRILRSILAIVIGAVVTVLVITGIQFLSHQFFPLPAPIDYSNPDALKTMVDSMPVMAKVLVTVAWCLGAFLGSWAACMVKPNYRRLAAIIVSSLVVVGTILNAKAIPHPLWMIVIGVVLPIPLGLLAERISRE